MAEDLKRGRVQLLPIVLVVVVLALVASLWVTRRPDDAETLPGPLAGIDPEAVVFVRFQDDTLDAQLSISGDRWHLIRPVRDRGNERLVQEMLDALRQPRVRRYLLDEGPSARFGLDPPRRCITLRAVHGESSVVCIGRQAPANRGYYATWSGLPGVAIVDRYPVERFMQASLFELREPHFVQLECGNMDSIDVSWRGGRQIRLRRTGERRWDIVKPEIVEADPIVLSRVTNFFRYNLLLDLQSEPSAYMAERGGTGLEPPTVVWILHAGTCHDTIQIGRRLTGTRRIVVRLPRRGYGLAGDDIFSILTAGCDTLRERRLMAAMADSVVRVDVRSPEGWRRFERSLEGWKVAAPEAYLLDSAASRRFNLALENLVLLRARRFLPREGGRRSATKEGSLHEEESLRVDLAALGGEMHWVAFGRESPDGDVAWGSRQPGQKVLVRHGEGDLWWFWLTYRPTKTKAAPGS